MTKIARFYDPGDELTRVSRTAQPEGAPYRWVPYKDGAERVFENELDACLEERCLTQAEFDGVHGDIAALVALAERGLLQPPEADGATPVRLDPDLWEIRWAGPRPNDALRIYHAEPHREPDLLLALKVHWKWWTERATTGDVDAAQDAEMLEAAARFRRSGLR